MSLCVVRKVRLWKPKRTPVACRNDDHPTPKLGHPMVCGVQDLYVGSIRASSSDIYDANRIQQQAEPFVLSGVRETLDVLEHEGCWPRLLQHSKVGRQGAGTRIIEPQRVTARPVACFGEWLARWPTD